MKKKIIFYTMSTVFAAVCYITLSSRAGGGAALVGVDGTNATGQAAMGGGCNDCHGSSGSIAVSVELDSAGVPVTKYYPGLSYTLKISGTNSTSHTLPKFGFQVAVVKSAGAGTSAATSVGTMSSSGLPSGVQYTPNSASTCGVDVYEQNRALTATTGTGGSGTTYVVTGMPFTAPASGTGAIKIYGLVNAVNGNGSSSGDYSNYTSTPLTINEAYPLAISAISKQADIKCYPNPAFDFINVELNNADAARITVYAITGALLMEQNIDNSAAGLACFNISNLMPGMYLIKVATIDGEKTATFVKN